MGDGEKNCEIVREKERSETYIRQQMLVQNAKEGA
jgi:hypothetical protein